MGDIVRFFPKIFPEIFYEYLIKGIEPPPEVSKCHIWGGYGGGEGVICGEDPHAKMRGGSYSPP